jgi:hypothetical protein
MGIISRGLVPKVSILAGPSDSPGLRRAGATPVAKRRSDAGS